jgi:hypothetical protein
MSVSDSQLLRYLSHGDHKVRSAALESLATSYSNEAGLVPTIFAGWDRYQIAAAYPEFPLVMHLPIQGQDVGECVQRAGAMVEGRKLTDRVCRCAGKLIESVSIAEPSFFAEHLASIDAFRISLSEMAARIEAMSRASHSLIADLDDGNDRDAYIALESLFFRKQADELLRQGFDDMDGATSRSQLSQATLSLATRTALSGFEKPLLKLIEHQDVSVADAATIGLARCRNAMTQTMIADGFAGYSRSAQLRAVEVIRRGRFAKSAELLHYLLPLGVDFAVQDSIRIAEVLLFDFHTLEDWLEAYLLADERSLSRIAPALALVEPLALEVVPDDWERIQKLMLTRMSKDID